MEKNILQSRVIDVLRFPMIVGVVLWHSFFEGIMGLDIPDSGIPIYHTTSFLYHVFWLQWQFLYFFLFQGISFSFALPFLLMSIKRS